MKYRIYGEYHQHIETVKFDTLKLLAEYLVEEYEAIDELCCIVDADGWGYNAVDLVQEQLEAAE